VCRLGILGCVIPFSTPSLKSGRQEEQGATVEVCGPLEHSTLLRNKLETSQSLGVKRSESRVGCGWKTNRNLPLKGLRPCNSLSGSNSRRQLPNRVSPLTNWCSKSVKFSPSKAWPRW